MRLQSKVAIVTGGGKGIGRSAAEVLARHGAAVTVTGRDAEALARVVAAIESAGGRALAIPGDIAQAEHGRAVVEQAVARFGGVDVLVNSAAHIGGGHDAEAMPESEWREVLSVNLDGVFYISKYALREMVKRGGGSIIHISSVEGVTGAPGHAAYQTAKAALFGLTRSMAIDFGKHNVRVNCVSPGIIDSGRPDIDRLKKSQAMMQWYRDMTVLGRMGRPEEVANVVLFLACDDSSYMTGQNLIVDGGWTIGCPPLPPSAESSLYEK